METKVLDQAKFIERLKRHNINYIESIHPGYFEFFPEDFASANEIATRTIILYALSFCAHEPDKREKVSKWLKSENVWEEVSEEERSFLLEKKVSQESRAIFTWKIEACNVLAWTLGLIDLEAPVSLLEEESFNQLVDKLPVIGSSISEFVSKSTLRPHQEIFEENLFNEFATTYFRDKLISGEPYDTDIDTGVSFERHYALNWVRRMSGIDEWDHTDTST